MTTTLNILLSLIALCSLPGQCFAFSSEARAGMTIASLRQSPTTLYAVDEKEKTKTTIPPVGNSQANGQGTGEYLDQSTKGGYTVKQRLREEINSPFRKVRLLAFGSSAGSAMLALYFSGMNTVKALVGGYSDAIPLDEALTSDGINIASAIICGLLALREYKAGQVNLAKLARGGKLAALAVEPAKVQTTIVPNVRRLTDYRRDYRVLIAGGGEEYISKLARSLNADQLKDSNEIPERLQETDVVVVPVLISQSGKDFVVSDTKEFWKSVEAGSEEDQNFDITRSDSVIAFPRGKAAWIEYLQEDINTASGQGFDVLEKGITLTVKKNGRILRRATGLPDWANLIGSMEVMDGSQFGMPGDSEKYGGP